jgi:hypothetical protein
MYGKTIIANVALAHKGIVNFSNMTDRFGGEADYLLL